MTRLLDSKALATGPFELIETPIHAKNLTVSNLSFRSDFLNYLKGNQEPLRDADDCNNTQSK